ncbi:MAG: DUF2062 domain-containing protein [Bacteroidota bacterium]|nr:DUF2062 domain-containing protein [Bacteroidota bacterium]
MTALLQYIRKQISKRVLIPIAGIRKQGVSTETLAFSVAIGVVGGAFPVLGLASYICLIMTLSFRQNIIIVQVANWLAYPIQIILLIPFMKLGHSIFAGGDLTITMHQVTVAFQSGIINGFREIGLISLYGIIAWTALSIPCLFIFYTLFLLFFRNVKRLKFKTSMVVSCKPKAIRDHILPMKNSLIVETIPTESNNLKAS